MSTMLEAKATVTERIVRSKGHEYRQMILYVPRDLVKDSQFPFKKGQTVKMRLDSGRLIIEKV